MTLHRDGGCPAADLVDLIRELAKRYTDAQIAGVLVRRRIKTPKRHLTFTARHVGDLRRSYDIPRCPDPSPDETARTYTVEQTARLLNVSPPTVYLWLKLGVLVGEQVTAQAPWQIQLTDADRNRLTPEPPPGWLTLAEAARELAISKQTPPQLGQGQKDRLRLRRARAAQWAQIRRKFSSATQTATPPRLAPQPPRIGRCSVIKSLPRC